jgi:hypothetical protein
LLMPHSLRRTFRHAPNLLTNAIRRIEDGDNTSEISSQISPKVRNLRRSQRPRRPDQGRFGYQRRFNGRLAFRSSCCAERVVRAATDGTKPGTYRGDSDDLPAKPLIPRRGRFTVRRSEPFTALVIAPFVPCRPPVDLRRLLSAAVNSARQHNRHERLSHASLCNSPLSHQLDTRSGPSRDPSRPRTIDLFARNQQGQFSRSRRSGFAGRVGFLSFVPCPLIARGVAGCLAGAVQTEQVRADHSMLGGPLRTPLPPLDKQRESAAMASLSFGLHELCDRSAQVQ